MADINIKYATYATLTHTAITTTLAAGEWAETSSVDNTSNLYVDALLGGKFAVGTGWTTGDSVDLYLYVNYDTGTAADIGGSIGGLDGTDSEETEGTDFLQENLIFLASITADIASTTYHFAGISVASACGGVMPPKWGLMVHNNGTGAMAAGSEIGYVGIEYTNV